MKLAEAFGESANREACETVIACLKAVAEADGEIAPRETALIDSIEQAMNRGSANTANVEERIPAEENLTQ